MEEPASPVNFTTTAAALLAASRYGDHEAARLLLARGADVDRAIDDEGFTPLFVASGNGHERVARLLLDSGADVHRAESSGYTPLHVASGGGHDGVARRITARRRCTPRA